MLLENYLIRRFLLRVKKLYLYMYMYLSDRIRRMFLSGACPQNLSPKKPLSLKDQRFLQKTKADNNLTRILVKEQKLLYEKHIGLLLQGSVLEAAKAYSNSKKEKQRVCFSNKEKNENNFATPIYWQVCSKAQKTIKTQKIDDRAHKGGNGLVFSHGSTTVPKQVLLATAFVGTEGKKEKTTATTNHGTSQKKVWREKESFSDDIWKACSNYNFPRKSLTLFVQSLKVQRKKTDNLKKQYNKNEKKNLVAFLNSDFLEKSQNNRKSKKPNKFDSHALLFHGSVGPSEKTNPLDHQKDGLRGLFFPKDQQPNHAMQALLNLGKSKYTNCRYLYDHESLKTCIVPQLFKNQKPISRAKTLLHERKKIALLYGQLAKKDILNISRKAMCIPGFFEDNMFTLLESRVDVCVFRAGFSKTIAGARQLIRNGSVLVNGKKINSCKRRAKPGDIFTFTFKQAFYNPYRYATLELYHLCLSSNFFREFSINKMKFLRELAFKQFETKKKQAICFKNSTSKTCPHPLLFGFFAVPPRVDPKDHHSKPAFCYSLYWGFFLYKLYKIPSFSCFFETKRKYNILLDALKKKTLCANLTPRVLSLDPCKQSFLEYQAFYNFEKKKPKAFYKLAVHGLIQRINAIHGEDSGYAKALPIRSSFSFFFGKKKNIVLLNLYTQLLLKKQENLKTKQNEKKSKPYFLFRKNIPYSNLWAIWGQKPLHLEISHKTGAFIYMYKPQKIISPVCLDFKP